MVYLNEFLDMVPPKIVGGDKYSWSCYGDNARYLDMENNVDVIFVFQQNNFNNKELFVLQYLNTDDRKNAGYELINKYAVGYQCLVISNTETSNNYEDY